MKTVTCKVNVINGRVWARVDESRSVEEADLDELLSWILDQLILGNHESKCDDGGDLTSLVIGADASPIADDVLPDGVGEDVKARHLTINAAGLFASAREEGIEPQYVALADKVRDISIAAGPAATQFHYAREFVGMLDRISRLSFVFSSPPIKTRASEDVIALLKEASRAYLFGLTRSSVSVCRALMEAALKERTSRSELLAARQQSSKGELELLISLASERGIIAAKLADMAHAVRIAGNRALHGPPPSDEVAWAILRDVRLVVAEIYAEPRQS